MENKNLILALKVVAILGFLYSIVNLEWGTFIGTLFAGLLFLLQKNKIFGTIMLLFSVYFLFAQIIY
ncbi:hypothetical protein [Neobacillus jeddahensis]|uniref:hypothetical protein n=1 Tax=Neobacillus jeddahensis TaxID=1461580 RepID=UPI0005AB3494|nr:hypothetical protein [Neobacillus jeddahensis]